MIKFSALVIFVLAMALTANGGTTPMRVPEKGVIFPIRNDKACSCYGIEGTGRGRGPRIFHIHCNYLNRYLECQYRGNPHGLTDYNKDQRNYYSQLLLMISKKVCQLPFGNCPKRSRGYVPEEFPDDRTTNFFFHA